MTAYPGYNTGGAPNPYSQPGSPYMAAPVMPRKRRGMKRIVFGIIGLVLSLIGLVALPILGGIIGAVLMGMNMLSPEEISNPGSFTADAGTANIVYVESSSASTTCSVIPDSSSAVVTPSDGTITIDVNGKPHRDVVQVVTEEKTEISVECPGGGSVAYSTVGAGWLLGLGAAGLIIPILTGLASLILLIWGIIARARS